MDNYIPLFQSMVTAGVSLLVAMGTWHFTEKHRGEDRKRHQSEELAKLKADLNQTLDEHREDYLEQINNVKGCISEMKAVYQQNAAIVEMKIDALEKKQDKHNSVIERTFLLEKSAALQEEQIKVANKRIEDLERHEEHRKKKSKSEDED